MSEFNFGLYLKIAADRMMNTCHTYDCAKSAEKMMDWDCAGDDNKAWQEGPFLSTGANEPQISHEGPYCLRVRDFSVAVFNTILEDPKISPNGGIELEFSDKGAEVLLSELFIVFQFSALEAYDFWCYQNALEMGKVFKIDTDKFT
jgi:hypothetical protein